MVSENFINKNSLLSENGTFNHLDGFQRLDKGDCMKTYSHQFLSTWGNLLLVTDKHVNASGVIDSWFTNPGQLSTTWNSSNPRLGPLEVNASVSRYNSAPAYSVHYCLAESTKPHCKIEIALSLLLGVVICNVVKVICFVTATIAWRLDPLATVGDAISSFLSDLDPTTQSLSLLSEHELRRLDCRSRYEKRRHRSQSSVGMLEDGSEYVGPFSRLQYNSTVDPTTYRRRRQRWYHVNELTGWWQLQLM